jgi:hypothetical protein
VDRAMALGSVASGGVRGYYPVRELALSTDQGHGFSVMMLALGY